MPPRARAQAGPSVDHALVLFCFGVGGWAGWFNMGLF